MQMRTSKSPLGLRNRDQAGAVSPSVACNRLQEQLDSVQAELQRTQAELSGAQERALQAHQAEAVWPATREVGVNNVFARDRPCLARSAS
jgi:hypothetical protein